MCADNFTPATYIIPTPYAGIALRRRMARRGGLFNVRFMVLSRLAEYLGAPVLAADGKSPLTPLVSLAAIRSIATEMAGKGPLGVVATHPQFHLYLRSTFNDLHKLDTAGLDRLAAQGDMLGQVIDWYRKFRQLTASRYTREELNRAAADSVKKGQIGSALQDLGQIIFYGVSGFTRGETALIKALASATGCRFIYTPSGDEEADAPLLREAEMLKAAGVKVEIEPGEKESILQADHLLIAPDAVEEVRWITRRIMRDAGSGIPFHRMAILYRNDDPYAAVIESQLRLALIPLSGPGSGTLRDSPAGKLLTGLLDLLDKDFDRARFMQWVSEAPICAGKHGYPVSRELARWEVISQEAGIVKGCDSWDRQLSRYLRQKKEQINKLEEEEDSSPARVRGEQDLLTSASRLLAFVNQVAAIKPPADGSRWSEFARWATGDILDTLSYHPHDWQPEQQDELDKIKEALNDIEGLDSLEAKATLAAFRLLLEDSLSSHGRQHGITGKGVFAAPARAAQLMDFDVVYIVGMSEGAFPPAIPDDALIPDSVRASLGEEDILPLRAGRRAEERRLYLAALEAGTKCIISYPLTTGTGGQYQYPSPWFLDAATQLHGSRLGTADLPARSGAGWLTVIESSQHGLKMAGQTGYADKTDYKLASLARWCGSGLPAIVHFLNAGDSPGGRILSMESARESRDFTEWDGNVNALAGSCRRLEVRDGQAFSASRLQTWAQCPLKYFFDNILNVTALKKPEDLLEIDAMEKGSLLHSVLERLVVESKRNNMLPAHGQPWKEESFKLLMSIAQDEFRQAEERGITGRPLFWQAARIDMLHDLEIFLRMDNEWRSRTRSQPAEVEYSFGQFRGQAVNPGPEVALEGGLRISFRGRIDRLDLDSTGRHAWVIDYKSGSAWAFSGMKQDPLKGGMLLQLPVYGLAARERLGKDSSITALYWFITSRGGFDQKEASLGEVEDRFISYVNIIVSGIRRGLFIANPRNSGDQFGQCNFCDYRRACHPRRRVHWERKCADPLMTEYIAMTGGSQKLGS